MQLLKFPSFSIVIFYLNSTHGVTLTVYTYTENFLMNLVVTLFVKEGDSQQLKKQCDFTEIFKITSNNCQLIKLEKEVSREKTKAELLTSLI